MNNKSKRSVGFGGWLRRQLRQRPKPLWAVVTADVLLVAVALCVFALFHHVLPRRGQSTGMVSSRATAGGASALVVETRESAGSDAEADGEPEERLDLSAMTGDGISFSEDGGAETDAAQTDATEADAAPTAETATAEPTAEPTAAPTGPVIVEADVASKENGDIPGYFGDKFAGRFTGGPVLKSKDGYQSQNLDISLKRYEANKEVFYVADIYIRDITCLVSAFAKGTYGQGVRDTAVNISKGIDAIIAINGDYYGARTDGIVIRNGELFREDLYPVRDVCVLFWDGTMETYEVAKFDAKAAIEAGAYQAWNFGPRLLDDEGNPMTKFNSDVGPANPRSVIGYYEPGHYCFVTVDGRQKSSSGLTLKQLSSLMHELGCVRAYNLDGGNTAVMVAGGKIVNNPSGGGRATSDIIAIVDN